MSSDDTSPDVRSYQLSADDNDRVFWGDIVPGELETVPAQEQPIGVFLIGQPGAGKSATADEIRDVFGDSGFVEVDSDIYSDDIYKAYHPRYAEILRLDDTLMAGAIGPDASARGVSARSPPRHWSCSTSSTAEPHDHVATEIGSLRSHCAHPSRAFV